MYSVLCAVYSVLCIVYCVLCIVYCVLCTVYFVLYTFNCLLCTVHCALISDCVLCIQVHCVSCAVYCVLCIVHMCSINILYYAMLGLLVLEDLIIIYNPNLQFLLIGNRITSFHAESKIVIRISKFRADLVKYRSHPI